MIEMQAAKGGNRFYKAMGQTAREWKKPALTVEQASTMTETGFETDSESLGIGS